MTARRQHLRINTLDHPFIDVGETFPLARQHNEPHTWERLDASQFRVRKGPDYYDNKEKAPSLPALFDVVAVDFFTSAKKIPHLTDYVKLPGAQQNKAPITPSAFKSYQKRAEVESKSAERLSDLIHDEAFVELLKGVKITDIEGEQPRRDSEDEQKRKLRLSAGKHARSVQPQKMMEFTLTPELTFKLPSYLLDIPPLLVIHTAFPNYEPSNPIWGKNKTDGPNFSCIITCKLSREGIKAINNETASAKLYEYFVNNIGDAAVEERFKCVPQIPDDSLIPLPSLLQNWNGKPFLTRPQHKFHKTTMALHVYVDVHEFAYLCRRPFNSLLNDNMDKRTIETGFVIEARHNHEMPEQLLCCLRVNRLHLDRLKPVQIKDAS